MRAVDIGIGHDDDALITQIGKIEIFSSPAAERKDKILYLLVGAGFVRSGADDVEDFTAQRKDGLCFTAAALLGASTRRVTLDDENLRAFGFGAAAIGELTGQAQFARCRLAGHRLVVFLALALFGAFNERIQKFRAGGGVAGKPVIEMVLDGGIN